MKCRDRLCGAPDCDLCHPGNPWQRQRESEREGRARDRADHERDRRKDDAGGES